MISIIIPTFNRAECLSQVIHSYLKQDHVKEIIIVDDHSWDRTGTLIQALQNHHPSLKYIRHEHNLGLPAARNSGVNISEGNYILFGEDDMIFPQDYAATLLSHIEQQQCDIIAGRLIHLAPDQTEENALQEADKSLGQLIDFNTLIPDFSLKTEDDISVPFIHACSLIKREVFHTVQFDATRYRVNFFREETDFYLNAIAAGFKICFCPHTQIFHFPRESPSVQQSGCRPKSRLKSKIWRQINNIRFLNKNRKILRKNLNLSPVRIMTAFLLDSLKNTFFNSKIP